MNYKILNNIKSPNDIKELDKNSLKRLCLEIRSKIVNTVSKTGGHLSSNLGVVELTVALEKEFNLPGDKIVWDVGHQCYPHKLLTGRFKDFNKLRQKNGISGYPKPSESEYDSFVSGHASNSISASIGLARAELLKGSNKRVISVIGDGSLTGGMAYEALNNAANLKNLIIVLNCNDMSISKTVGGFSKYLSNMRSNQNYIHTRNLVNNILDKTPIIGKPIKKQLVSSKLKVKSLFYSDNLFTAFGFSYLGPINGHNLDELHNAFNWAKNTECPALIQVFTKKGKGYIKAEKNPSGFHGVSPFNIKTGSLINKNKHSFSDEFGDQICKLAKKDERICAITAAMRNGTGLDKFAKDYKERFFDVGIAEEHAVTFAAGLSKGGYIPIFAVYSTFLQRSYDQILHDASISDIHIILAIDRAGIVGEDGETHQGVFDIPFLSTIPNTTIYSPATFIELKHCLIRGIYNTKGVVAIRYPRGGEPTNIGKYAVPEADFQVIGDGDVLLITYGRETSEVIEAAKILDSKGIKTTILKLCKVHPLSESAIKIALGYKNVFFIEESSLKGGPGETFIYLLVKNNFKGKYYLNGIEDKFIKHSTAKEALKDLKLDSVSLAEYINIKLQQTNIININKIIDIKEGINWKK